MFPTQNCLKRDDDLSLPLFIFPLEYTVRKVKLNQVRLELNGTYRLLVYSEVASLLATKMNTANKTQNL
jgi:hypothetical protein